MILINDVMLIDYGLTGNGFNPVKELWFIERDLSQLAMQMNEDLILN